MDGLLRLRLPRRPPFPFGRTAPLVFLRDTDITDNCIPFDIVTADRILQNGPDRLLPTAHSTIDVKRQGGRPDVSPFPWFRQTGGRR